MSQVVEDLPREVERLVKRCLRKDPAHRVQHMDDLKVALEELKEESDSGELAATATAEKKRFPLTALAAIVVIVVAVLAYWLTRPLPPPKVTGSTQLTHDGQLKGRMVTDGARLFFGEHVAERSVLAQTSVAGGKPVPISTPFQNTSVLDISPDRTELLLCSWVANEPEMPLWTLPTLGGSPRRLADILGHNAAWGPDGKTILYATGQDLYVAGSDGSQSRKLASLPGTASDVRWSPDGNSLAYGGRPDPLWQVAPIHVLNLQTHQVSNVPGSEGIFAPRWSPNGRYIAAIKGFNDKLMLFDFATQKWEELAQLNAGYMAWSSDSETLYFDTSQEKDSAFYRLRMSNRTLERLVSLKNVRRVIWLFGPWSGLTADNSPLVLPDTGSQDIYALDWEAP